MFSVCGVLLRPSLFAVNLWKLTPTMNRHQALSQRVAAENARLLKSEKKRVSKNVLEIDRSKLPFIPPAHWVWVRLVDIARVSYGFAFPSSKFNTDKRGMPLIRIRDISRTETEAYFEGDFDPTYVVHPGDYLVGMDGDFNLRRWAGEDGLLNQRVMRINEWRCGINPEFVKLPLST
jgi:type I restriction enzyme S subunit